jgi:hypothetical protein
MANAHSNQLSTLRARLQQERMAPSLHRQHNRSAAQKIDRHCRWAFPAAFAVFNAIYWPYYYTV